MFFNLLKNEEIKGLKSSRCFFFFFFFFLSFTLLLFTGPFFF